MCLYKRVKINMIANNKTIFLIKITADFVSLMFAMWLAMSLRLDVLYKPTGMIDIIFAVMVTIVSVYIFYLAGLYPQKNAQQQKSIPLMLFIGVLASTVFLAICIYIFNINMPRSVPIIYMILSIFFTGVIRLHK